MWYDVYARGTCDTNLHKCRKDLYDDNLYGDGRSQEPLCRKGKVYVVCPSQTSPIGRGEFILSGVLSDIGRYFEGLA